MSGTQKAKTSIPPKPSNGPTINQAVSQSTSIPYGQNETINGTGEINYQATSQSIGRGPQLIFDKHHLCMMTPVSNIQQDKIVVTNVGTTTVTYDWKKSQRGDYIQSKNSDFIQRFYCHYPRSILKPGESKAFTFSFRSVKPGMYFEEWELLTEPLLLQPLPLVNLSGMATLEDAFTRVREETAIEFEYNFKNDQASEIFDDIFHRVKTPTPPLPNMRDPQTFKHYFETNNKHLGLYFTQSTMDQTFELLQDVQSRLGINGDPSEINSEWDGRIEYIESLISQVPNPYSKESLHQRYVRLLYQAKKVPTDRAQSYPVIRQMLLELCGKTPKLEAKAREELQMPENFGFEVPREEQTEEEAKKLEDDRKAKKADWIKKSKKKPKSEDEEAKDLEDLKLKVIAQLASKLVEKKIEKAESNVELVRTEWLMQHHLVMDESKYDELNRKESILDVDISGKDLILRLDLDVPLSPYTPPPPASEVTGKEDNNKSQTRGNVQKQTTKLNTQQQQQELLNLTAQKDQEEPWRKRDILDHSLIKKAMVDIRYSIEHLANRTFVMANLGEKCGKIKPENSMKIIYNVLQQQLMEQQMIFLPDAIIKDYEVRRENEEFPESTTFVLENLNFKPDEFGYVEPEKPPEEPKPSDEELKKQEEEQKAALAAQQKGKPATTGKIAPADKKKQEEEAKKKAEEEAKKKAQEAALEKLNQLSEEEQLEQQRQKEEAERRKRELEYFDYKTIHRYKEHLGKYGDIYVNDAPLLTLTNSNSIAEIRCKKKVMGIRMTEEVRKLAQFFLKKNPQSINTQFQRPPPQMVYQEKSLCAVLGGACKSPSEILDKILLANSLLDTADTIHFFGEVALAALHSLGIKVGQVERTKDNKKDYDKFKKFFKALFKKAAQKQVKLVLPIDFVCSPKMEFEDSSIPQNQPTEGATGLNTTQQQAKTDRSKLNITGEEEDTRRNLSLREQWKPTHWSDKVIDRNLQKSVTLKDKIGAKLNKIIEKQVSKDSPLYDDSVSKEHANDQGELDSDDYVFEFGPLTMASLHDSLHRSFKHLWDGSLSMFKDCVLSSQNNKAFVEDLFELRTQTSNDNDPPVTLLHGTETEQVVRSCLMRIKVEQAELAEAQKRLARENGEEVESEEEQMALDESKEEASTIQQDMAIMADFFCFEVPPFTMKMMQGVPNRSIYNLDEHRKKSRDNEEENLFILDEI